MCSSLIKTCLKWYWLSICNQLERKCKPWTLSVGRKKEYDWRGGIEKKTCDLNWARVLKFKKRKGGAAEETNLGKIKRVSLTNQRNVVAEIAVDIEITSVVTAKRGGHTQAWGRQNEDKVGGWEILFVDQSK